jgi:hypothetical protein
MRYLNETAVSLLETILVVFSGILPPFSPLFLPPAWLLDMLRRYILDTKVPGPFAEDANHGGYSLTFDGELDETVREIIDGIEAPIDAADAKRGWISERADWVDDGIGGVDLNYPSTDEFLDRILEDQAKDPPETTPAQCMDFANLLLAMLRKEGIAARVVEGRNVGGWNFHRWVELWDSKTGKWMAIDATSNDLPDDGDPHGDMDIEEDAIDPINYAAFRGWSKEDGSTIWAWDGDKWVERTDDYFGSDFFRLLDSGIVVLPSTDRPEYLIGENVTVTIEFTNTNPFNKTVSSNTLVKLSPETYEEMIMPCVFNKTEIVAIPAGQSVNLTYTLNMTECSDNGNYTVTVSTNETSIGSVDFCVRGGVAIAVSMPSTVDENLPFSYTLNVTNVLSRPINNLTVFLSFPGCSSVSDTSFNIDVLSPGDQWSTTFLMNMSRYGEWCIWATARSLDSGFVYETSSIKVMSPPLLEVRNDYSPTEVQYGETSTVNATINNLGDYPLHGLTATLQLFKGITTTDPLTKSAGDLGGGENITISWTVNASLSGNFKYAISVIDGTGMFKKENYALVISGEHDVAISNVSLYKTVVGQGFSMSINVTVADPGIFAETFNVTAYANTTDIATFTNITLTSGSSTTITFTWNTTGFATGNYTLSAYAWPVPGETHTADNTFADCWVIVAMVGDITGPSGWPDGDCDIRDVSAVARLFGVSSPSPEYNPNFDINGDGDIDIKDVSTVARHFGEHYP